MLWDLRMEKWSSRRREPGLHQKEAEWPTWTPKHGRPPPSPVHSCHSVAPWEIKFCSQISWKKFCKNKKLTYLFDNVLNWDDSAGKEAFDNAKARYWAEINGLPCDIPLPNPDVYIDVVNQYTSVDPQLLEDLYEKPPTPPHKEFTDYSSVEIIPTGWDVEEPSTVGDTIPRFISAKHSGCNVTGDAYPLCSNADNAVVVESSGWGCAEPENLNTEKNTAEDPITIIPTGWGDEEDFGSSHACDQPGRQSNGAYNADSGNRDIDLGHHSWSWMNDKAWCDGKDIHRGHVEYKNRTTDRSYGNRRDRGGFFSLKHATVRYQGQDYHHKNNNSIGHSGRRKNHTTDEHWLHGKPSCAPVIHQRSASSGGVWHWQKSAS